MKKEDKIKIRLRVDGYDDRRDLVSILADNGYAVKIQVDNEELTYLNKLYWVIIEIDNKNILSNLSSNKDDTEK